MAVRPSDLPFPPPAPPPLVRPEAPAFPPAAGAARSRKRFGYAFNLLTAFVMVAALTTAGLIGGASVTGHHFETVVTGSMQPQIPIGSLVMTQRVSASQLQVGDVIVFPAPCEPGKIVVHRVAQLTNDAGRVLISTKGDANAASDVWRSDCSSSQSGGALAKALAAPTDRVVFILPVLGNALDVGRRFAFVLLLVTGGLVILGVGIREVRRFLSAPRGAQP